MAKRIARDRLAAAEPVGDPALLWRAVQALGIPETAANDVELEGLLNLDGSATFRHPLVRSAVYDAASGEDEDGFSAGRGDHFGHQFIGRDQ